MSHSNYFSKAIFYLTMRDENDMNTGIAADTLTVSQNYMEVTYLGEVPKTNSQDTEKGRKVAKVEAISMIRGITQSLSVTTYGASKSYRPLGESQARHVVDHVHMLMCVILVISFFATWLIGRLDV
eukprot:1226480-Amphidinium_carterae.1